MTPLPWSSVRIDPTPWDALVRDVEAHQGANAACQLGPYWQDRMSPQMAEAVTRDGKLPYGFVGSGWPYSADQSWVLAHDPLNLARAYHENDIHTRDAGDSIYQANILIPEIERRWPGERISIADIGSGYGRLAVPFLAHYGDRLTYFAIDYSPIGLLTAPQFIEQVTDANVLRFTPEMGARITRLPDPGADLGAFLSLPAWMVDAMVKQAKVFLTIHSFQEMEQDTIAFYVQWIGRKAAPGALFLSVNLDENIWLPMLPATWRRVDVPEAPCNRDGVYRQMMWEVR